MYNMVSFKSQNQYPPYNPYVHGTTNICGYSMELEGRGSIKVQPDIAIVTLGVVTENKELKIAQEENAKDSTRMLDSLKKMGIKEDDIETEAYSIDLQYDYIEGQKIFRGYKVTHNFKITIRDLEKTGKIIDTAVSNGANVVKNIYFTLSNPSIYYRQALTLAIQDAIEKAEVIENKLQVIVNKTPTRISEERYDHIPLYKRPSLGSPDTTTPIKAGKVEIIANIKAVFAYKG
ncbi:SIMPL domain-containing protein [Lutibacter sp. B2]|nr:SIMPL domain-containing protein [Lutibacter sp. B2]